MKRLLLPLALALALAVPATAAAKIVVNVSIAGVKPGDSLTAVRNTLGTPSSVRNGSNDFGPYSELRYASRGLSVFSQGKRVATSIETRSARERTAGGLGVGSTLSAVRAAFRREQCSALNGKVRLCNVGALVAGRRVTTFRFTTSGKVNEVSVGVVID